MTARLFDQAGEFVETVEVTGQCLPRVLCRGDLLYVPAGPVAWSEMRELGPRERATIMLLEKES